VSDENSELDDIAMRKSSLCLIPLLDKSLLTETGTSSWFGFWVMQRVIRSSIVATWSSLAAGRSQLVLTVVSRCRVFFCWSRIFMYVSAFNRESYTVGGILIERGNSTILYFVN